MQASLERLRERRREGDEGGFTLIELLIVIVILAILAAIVVFAVDAMTTTSAKASCESDVQTVDHAVQAYFGSMDAYPTSITVLEQSATAPDGSTVGPWLHNTPANGHHYNIVVTDGSKTAGDNLGTPTLPTAGPPAALTGGTAMWADSSGTFPNANSTAAGTPRAGVVLVQTWDTAPSSPGFANSELYYSPANPTNVTGTITNTTSAACNNIT